MRRSEEEISKTNNFWIQNLLWYSPLWLSILFSFYQVGFTGVDSGVYIYKAIKFTQGEFDLLFRPGFIYLLGSTFKILEPSVWAATALVRVFFAANVILIFFMTRYLYSKYVAFAAAMTLLSSYYLNYFSHRILLDNVHPFFVLLSLFLSLMAVDRKSYLLAAAAGLAFIYTYLVKVTIVLFLPFPIVAAVFCHAYKMKWSNLRQPILTTCISGIGIISYHLLVHAEERNTQAQIGFKGSLIEIHDLLLQKNLAESLYKAFDGFILFWEKFLFLDTKLGCLFVASWIWLIIRSFKSNSSRAIMATFIMFLPAAMYLGLTNLRLGQAGVLLFITFISVGLFLHDIAAVLIRGAALHLRLPDYLVKTVLPVFLIAATLTVCIYQVWYADSASKKYLGKTYIGRKITGKDTTFVIRGTLNERNKKTAQIIDRHGTPGDRVYTGKSNLWAIHFFTGYKYQVVNGGLVKRINKINSLKPNFGASLPSSQISGRLLFLWPNGWRHQLTNWNKAGELRLRYIDEASILRVFGSNRTAFVAPDKRLRHFGKYLDQASASGVKKISSDPLIYSVKDFSLSKDFGLPRVALELGKLLAELRTVHPENYQVIRNRFFPDFFGIKPEQVDGIADLNAEAGEVVFIQKRW